MTGRSKVGEFPPGGGGPLILPLHHKTAKYHFTTIQDALTWYNNQTLAFNTMKEACLHVPLEELLQFMRDHPRHRDRLKWLVLAGPPSIGPPDALPDPPLDDFLVADVARRIDTQWRDGLFAVPRLPEPEDTEPDKIIVVDVRCDFTFYQPATTLYGAVMWYVPPLDVFRPSICNSKSPISLLTLCMNPEHEMAFNSRKLKRCHIVIFYRQSNCPRLAEVTEATKYLINSLRQEGLGNKISLLKESDLFSITYSMGHLVSSIHFGCNTKECEVPKGPSQVIPGLWVGSIRDAVDEVFISQNRICRIVKLCRGGTQPNIASVTVIRYHLLDQNWFVLRQHIEAITQLVHEGLQSGRGVFVCCSFGRSRSVSVVLSYLMKYRSMTFDQAFQAVWRRRWFAYPNMGFYEQLKAFDQDLRGAPPDLDTAPAVYDTYSYHALMYDIQAELQKGPTSRYHLPIIPSARLATKLGFETDAGQMDISADA